jgi:ElaB/YqjD/DUF883 family membrane-anchored ribosome-binding protein
MATPKHEPEVQPETKALKDDIAALRRDFSSLAEKLRNGEAGRSLERTLEDLSEEAKILYEKLSSNLSSQAKPVLESVEKVVEQRPVMWIAAAFLLGFIGSRLIDRR